MTLYKWSQTAAADATADSTINWAEGQAPSSVNDSARAMMAAIAKYRDDIAGAIVTGGTATAYTVTSYQVFSSLSAMDGKLIAFSPHTTNTAGSPAVSLNVDGLGAKSLQVSPGVELPAGFLVSGSPYVALYNALNGVFYLQNSFGNPYSIPIGGSLDFWGSTAPNSSFALMYGQAISRTTYSVLFGLFSTTYGVGDGSSTFNIPDLRGRISAGKDDMGGSAASRLTSTYFGGTATTLGAVGGLESHTLTTAQLAAHSHGVTDPGHGHTSDAARRNESVHFQNVSTTLGQLSESATINANTTGISINNAGGGGAHNNVQPTIITNKLLRLI